MRHMTVTWHVVLLQLTLTQVAAQPQKVAPPTCGGRDLFAEMKTSDPKGFDEVRDMADATVNARAVLWRIKGQGQSPSFLFGTVHSTDDRVHKFSGALQSAFEGARKVALELVELASRQDGRRAMNAREITSLTTYRNGQSLADQLSEAELKRLNEILRRRGIPAENAYLLRPWFAWSAFDIPECEKRRMAVGSAFLDQRLGEEARKRGQPVIGLETIGSQINMLAGLPEAAQLDLLKRSLVLLDNQEDLLEVLIRLYLARDLGAIMPFNAKFAEKLGFDPALLVPTERDLVEKRNVTMRNAALPLLQEGNAFIAVGALHLPGKGGLVELFRAAGYTVTPVD